MKYYIIGYTIETFNGTMRIGTFKAEFRDKTQAEANAFCMVVEELEEKYDDDEDGWMTNIKSISITVS